MKGKINPLVAVLAILVVVAICGYLGMKLFGGGGVGGGGEKAYVAGVKPEGLEQHVNQPKAISGVGGGSTN